MVVWILNDEDVTIELLEGSVVDELLISKVDVGSEEVLWLKLSLVDVTGAPTELELESSVVDELDEIWLEEDD